MTMRKTPYMRLRYPWTSDVVSAPDVQSMGSDIDASLVLTAKMGSDFSRFGSVVARRLAAVSLTKATLTAISFDSVTLNNGANSPLSNGVWWKAASPTRLTAPVACVALVSVFGGVNFGAALGTSGALQISARLNGSGQQGNKFSPISTVTGQQWTSALTMWSMAANDYVELCMYWTGSPAGPYNTDTVIPPQMSLTMVALPSVP